MSPAPGWYRDPYDPEGLRWWDGAHWTAQTARALPSPLVQAPTPSVSEVPTPLRTKRPSVFRAFADGFTAPLRWGAHHLIPAAIACIVVMVETFVVGQLDEPTTSPTVLNLSPFVLCALLCGIFARLEQRSRRTDGDATSDHVVRYLAAMLISIPVTVVLEVMVAVVEVGVVVAVLFLTAKFFGFGRSDGATSAEPAEIIRGANSHYTKTGNPKVCYLTEREAVAAAADETKRFGEEMTAYECGQGGHFHIGHAQPAWEREAA